MDDMSPAPTVVNIDLALLAEQTRADVQAGNSAVADGLSHWIAAGAKLIAAKAQIAHGGWLRHVNSCDLSEDKAERYMFLARHRADLDSAGLRNLTLTGALRLIKQKTSKGAKPGRKPKPPAPTSKLDSIAWGDATLEERRHFLNAIDVNTVLEAMPASWREILRQRVLGLAEAHANPRARAAIQKERARQPYDLELTAAPAA